MEITYIFRAPSSRRSIERVFEPIIDEMRAEGHDVKVNFAFKGRNLLVTLWRNIRFFRRLSESTLCHITGDVQYVACMMNPQNTILTVHDLVALHNEKVPWYSKWLCYWLWYYIPFKRIKHITCISEATRKDIISNFPWVEKKLTVITNSFDPAFHFSPKLFNLSKPKILHIGTKSNKNLYRVIEALKGINCSLRIIGKLPEYDLKQLECSGIEYTNVPFVTDEQIVQEYIDCDIVSFPSTFEGFGMPIIEGQATGRIVVTSNIEPMASVAGNGAILVDPFDIVSIRDGFEKAIRDVSYRESIIKHGLKNSELYSPKFISDNYKKLYKKICTTY